MWIRKVLDRPSDFVDMNDSDLVFNQTREYVDKRDFKDLLIMGDFNFPMINWSNGNINSIRNDNGIEFYETLSDTFLYQHVNVPTFKMSNEMSENTLDLIFTTESSCVNGVDSKIVLGDIVKGHLVILFDFNLNNRCDYEPYESY
jgi:hypothetical protein